VTERIDWRLPAHRREAFQRFYSFHLKYRSHPGMVYSFLPAIAEAYDLDDDGRAWLAWLNGNTQNPAMSLLLLEAAPHPGEWRNAVAFWNDHFKLMDFDTDRRHQKGKFGEATEKWAKEFGLWPSMGWKQAGATGWQGTWKYANSQPYMGRLSAWSMMEYARILLGPDVVPDMGSWLLEDKSGSRSHRNGIAVVMGYDATFWEADVPDMLGIVEDLRHFADELLDEARYRNPGHPDVGRLTMESALCTYKSWHKPNRRYPNVYADMAYNRLLKAEARFGKGRFDILWSARFNDLPPHLRLEDRPNDPGLTAVKQNHYLETGEVIMMHVDFPDMQSSFNDHVADGSFGIRKDPKW
jgi:hypothetical protein